jgi:hypothetical protein
MIRPNYSTVSGMRSVYYPVTAMFKFWLIHDIYTHFHGSDFEEIPGNTEYYIPFVCQALIFIANKTVQSTYLTWFLIPEPFCKYFFKLGHSKCYTRDKDEKIQQMPSPHYMLKFCKSFWTSNIRWEMLKNYERVLLSSLRQRIWKRRKEFIFNNMVLRT